MPAVLAVLLADLVASDGSHGRHGRHGRQGRRGGRRGRGGRSGFGRQGRQDNAVEDEVVPGGVDFSDCEMQDDGMFFKNPSKINILTILLQNLPLNMQILPSF